MGGGVNDLIAIAGDLTLDGTLNVAALPGFTTGAYRLMNYGGTLIDNVLDFGVMPTGFAYQLQAGLPGQVSLMVGNEIADPVQYWEGGSTVGDGLVAGGSGIWTAGLTNWTTSDGTFNQGWGGQTAVFAGAPGTVTVVGPISFNGLQFLTSGYTLAAGSEGVLQTTTADTPIRLNPNVTATIGVPIVGSGGLTIQGAGTLIFTGENTYTGGTTIGSGSTLQIGNGGTTGSIVGNVTNEGTLAFNRSNTITFGGNISGTGRLRQEGAGTLILTGENTYTGGTTIASGSTLQIGDGGTSGSIVGQVSNDGALVFNRADRITFDGTISGAGVLRQYGSGTLVLSGVNTYSGGTLINAGTLSIAADANLGTGALVIDGGTLQTTSTFSSGRPTTLSTKGGTIETVTGTTFTAEGGFGGEGALTKSGGGTLTLRGFNTYSGGTRIDAGTLSISNDANLGASSGAVTFGGGTLQTTADVVSSRAIAINRSGSIETANNSTVVLQGGITGGGALNKSGNGLLILTATNSYTGGTNVLGGALQLGNCTTSGAISGNVRNDGVLVFSRSDDYTFRGSISGNGALVKNCTGTTTLTGNNTYAGGTLVNAGTLQGDTGTLQGEIVDNAALVFDQSFDGAFRGTLFGSGTLTKVGTGTVTLNGNHGLQGRTTIQSGALSLDGTLSGAVSVLRDGAFNASGAIGGALLVEGRLNVPSTASRRFGLLGVVGDATLRPESIYGVTLDAAGQNSALTSDGRAGVHGATVSVTALPGTYGRVTQYAVLRGRAGLSGTASTTTSSPMLEPILSQNDTTLFVTLLNKQLPLQPFAISENGWRLGGALDRLKGTASGDLADVTRELTALDDGNLARSLDAVSGEIHASAVQLTAIDGESVTDAIRSEITNRISQGRFESGGRGVTGWGFDGGRGWFRFRGERATFEASQPMIHAADRRGVRGGDGSINGFTMGGDWTRANHWLFGVGGGYATGRMTLGGLDDSTKFTAPRGLAYLGYSRSWWALNGGVTVARTAYETTRSLQFTALAPAGGPLLDGVDRTATSRPEGLASEVWSEVRVDSGVGSWRIQPTAGLRRARYGVNDWNETGADSLSLSAPAHAIESLQADLGVRMSKALGRFRPYVGVTARRELTGGETAVALNLSRDPNGVFEVDGLRLPQHSTIGQAGLVYQAGRIGLSVMYEARRARQQTRHTIQLAIGFQ